jgi:hypothetical protein
MSKIKLNRETLRALDAPEDVSGGGVTTLTNIPFSKQLTCPQRTIQLSICVACTFPTLPTLKVC